MTAFATNVFKVLRGTAAAQAIGLLALPLLSRLFDPASFGALQALQALLAILLVASALRLEIAILSVSSEELPHLLALCCWLCVGTSLLSLSGVLAWTAFYPIETTKVGGLIYLLPLVMLLAGLGQVMSYLLLRRKEFDLSAGTRVAQALAFTGSALAASTVWPTGFGLVLSDAVGRLVLVVCAGRRRIRALFCELLPSRSALRSAWQTHRRLITVSLPGALINTLGAAYTPLLMLIVFDANQAGQYALVERLLGTPIALICGAASQVFISGFADARSGRTGTNPRALYRRLVAVSFGIGLVPALLLFWLAPRAVPWVLGPDWTMAGLFAQALMPLMLASFIVVPVNMALVLNGNQGRQFAWDVGRLVAVAATWLAIASMRLDPLPAIWLYGIVATLTYVVYLAIADAALVRPSSADNATPLHVDVRS